MRLLSGQKTLQNAVSIEKTWQQSALLRNFFFGFRATKRVQWCATMESWFLFFFFCVGVLYWFEIHFTHIIKGLGHMKTATHVVKIFKGDLLSFCICPFFCGYLILCDHCDFSNILYWKIVRNLCFIQAGWYSTESKSASCNTEFLLGHSLRLLRCGCRWQSGRFIYIKKSGFHF